jgi:hypothetical protein
MPCAMSSRTVSAWFRADAWLLSNEKKLSDRRRERAWLRVKLL